MREYPKVIIYGNVPQKSNSYRIGQQRLFKTARLTEYEDRFYLQCGSYRNANIKGFFEFYIDVYFPSMKSDLDNSLKIVLDCLQRAKAFPNDNRCVKIVAQKFIDKEKPRIEFYISEV